MALRGAEPAPRRWQVAAALAGLFAAQIFLAVTVPLLPEEAYHWNFARHLDWSYYDHPPMIAWAIALGRLVLGDARLGVRLVPLFFALGTTGLVAGLATRFYGRRAAMWAVLLCALQPAGVTVGAWGFPDAPLLFFWTLTLTLCWRALETGRTIWWLACGAALGASLLSKYTAAFLLPSILLYLLCSERDRRWLKTPWPYLAGACSLAVFAPVFYWNWTHDWASFRFQSVARFNAASSISPLAGLHAAAEHWLLILPVTLPLAAVSLWRLAWSKQRPERFLLWSFAPAAAFFLAMGWTPSFHLLWSLPAYLGLTVATAGVASLSDGRVASLYRRHWRWLVGVAMAVTVLTAAHTACVLPRLRPLPGIYGWDAVAAQCKALRSTLSPDSFYVAAGNRSYGPSSQLAFHLNDPDQVYGPNLIGWPGLQYQYWADPALLAGRDAVVVVEGAGLAAAVESSLRRYFRAVEPGLPLNVPIGWPSGRRLPPARFVIFRARGYRPEPAPAGLPGH